MYDTVNQSKTPFITHVAPASTNLTMTFNNQLNTVHNQVSGGQGKSRHEADTAKVRDSVSHQAGSGDRTPYRIEQTKSLYCHVQLCKKVFVFIVISFEILRHSLY